MKPEEKSVSVLVLFARILPNPVPGPLGKGGRNLNKKNRLNWACS
jgi:hypothetical protein